MTQGTFFVPGPGESLRISPLAHVSSMRLNRRRHTFLWRILCFAAGVVIGWLTHGLL